MANGWRVTAQDIVQWTKTSRRQAQDTLPRLVRKLVLASTNPSLISFPAGDSVLVGGWDGILSADEGTAFFPKGDSFWEFSTSSRINEKANDDYQKRTSNPQGIDTKKTTFVFVTSQKWANRDDWVKEKCSESQWAQVKGLNADDLETWLECMHACIEGGELTLEQHVMRTHLVFCKTIESDLSSFSFDPAAYSQLLDNYCNWFGLVGLGFACLIDVEDSWFHDKRALGPRFDDYLYVCRLQRV